MTRPNPYEILGIEDRAATHTDILAALARAMKQDPARLRDFAEAHRQLFDPVQRAVADFLFFLEPVDASAEAPTAGGGVSPEELSHWAPTAIDLEWKWPGNE